MPDGVAAFAPGLGVGFALTPESIKLDADES